MGADPLHALTTMHPWLVAPSRCHRDVAGIEKSICDWADRVGLETEPDWCARMGFALMAARAFPETDAADVATFGQWLAWLLYFDDQRDEGSLGHSVAKTAALFEELLLDCATQQTATRGEPTRVAFGELWRGTSAAMSPAWRQRIQRRLSAYAEGCIEEVHNRLCGRVPSLTEYPGLRSRTNGPFMWELVEPVLGLEVPVGLAETATWTTLVESANDVIAWCNDVASLPKERRHGEVHNFVVVAANTLNLSTSAATEWVLHRILARINDMQRAARELPALFAEQRLSPAQAREVSKVAVVMIAAPRGHLDWL